VNATKPYVAGYGVFTAMKIHVTVFWVVMM